MHGVPELAADRVSPRTRATVEMRGLLHDLGHGLATLSLLTDGLTGDPALPTRTRERLEVVDQEINRMLDLVTRSPHEPAPEAVDVRSLLSRLVDVVAPSAPATVTLLPGAHVQLQVDPAMLWRMVTNLVDNAARAAGEGGTVDISVVDGDAPSVEVVDDGPGFGRSESGVASLGIGVVTALAGKCGGRLRMRPAHPCGTRAELVFPGPGGAAGPPRSGTGGGHGGDHGGPRSR